MARVSMVPEVVFIEVVGIGDFFGIIANRETIGLFHLRLLVSVIHLRPAFILGQNIFVAVFLSGNYYLRRRRWLCLSKIRFQDV